MGIEEIEEPIEMSILDRKAFKKDFAPEQFLNNLHTLLQEPTPKSLISETSAGEEFDIDSLEFE